MQRALSNRVLDAIFDNIRETLTRCALIVAESLRVTCRILDAPLDVVIDDQSAVFAGKKGLPLETLRDDAPLELADGVDRPLEVQTRTVAGANDLAELTANRQLVLRNRERTQADDET